MFNKPTLFCCLNLLGGFGALIANVTLSSCLVTINEYMKSEIYREPSNQSRTRKSTVKPNNSKSINQFERILPLKMTKGIKSVYRGTNAHSIEAARRREFQVQEEERISFAPLLKKQSVPTQSTDKCCAGCEQIRQCAARELKSLRMSFQEQMTDRAQKYIQMQRKYLHKQNQFIKLSKEHQNLFQSYNQLEIRMRHLQIECEQFHERCLSNEQEISRLLEDLKKYQDQNKFFNQFLSVFVDQTKCMLNWCKLFEVNCEQLPSHVQEVKQELFCRKVDLDLILKESVSYKNANFGNQTIQQMESSCFFSQQDENTSLMKYFRHTERGYRVKASRVFPLTEIKERSIDIENYNLNKENIDIGNRPSFESLIKEKIEQQRFKNIQSNNNDQILRMLLTQAQAVQANSGLKSSSPHQYKDGNVSFLSSIAKQVDFDCY